MGAVTPSMFRLVAFVAIATAWTVTLVIVAAFAGWTFVAVRSADVIAVGDPAMRSVDPALLTRFVGGRVTQVPFDLVTWASMLMPAVLISFIGGKSAKIDWSALRWWRMFALITIALAFLHAIGLLDASIRLRECAQAFWEVAGSGRLAEIDAANAALGAAHLHARNVFMGLVVCAAASTVCGSLFLTRRTWLVSHP